MVSRSGRWRCIGAPRSILHDELLGSAGYPGADEWAGIDDKREELLRAALKQFASDHSDLVESLLESLTKLKELTTTGLRADAPPQARRRLLASQQPRRRSTC